MIHRTFDFTDARCGVLCYCDLTSPAQGTPGCGWWQVWQMMAGIIMDKSVKSETWKYSIILLLKITKITCTSDKSGKRNVQLNAHLLI